MQKQTTLRPCAEHLTARCWYGEDIYFSSTPCPATEDQVESLVDFQVLASADIYKDATLRDPREVSRDKDFENAIKALYESVSGSFSYPSPGYYFSLNIREQTE